MRVSAIAETVNVFGRVCIARQIVCAASIVSRVNMALIILLIKMIQGKLRYQGCHCALADAGRHQWYDLYRVAQQCIAYSKLS